MYEAFLAIEETDYNQSVRKHKPLQGSGAEKNINVLMLMHLDLVPDQL